MTLINPLSTAHGAGGVIHWFRQDLRLGDNPALHASLALARARGAWWLPVFVHDTVQAGPSVWGFERMGPHRRAWWLASVNALADRLNGHGHTLHMLSGEAAGVLHELCHQLGRCYGPITVVCEHHPAPEEMGSVDALRAHSVEVRTVDSGTLLAIEELPFDPADTPDTFTDFRRKVESSRMRLSPEPMDNPFDSLSPLPCPLPLDTWHSVLKSPIQPPTPAQVEGVWSTWAVAGEAGALAHLRDYCAKGLPSSYKATRNQLQGDDASSKWSPWLATGALSARQAMSAIRAYEATHGANDSTYWLWFELLWRDHFRLMHHKHGRALFRQRGLSRLQAPVHDKNAFTRWCDGETGEPLVDAAMRELKSTGWLSNRARQIVASFLIHDLGCDWRAGAAWFESRLMDFDVCSNQGNWSYIAGRGTDPRGGRRFNMAKQTADHDANGTYRKRWGVS